ncbi:MAG: ABC transporter ATP-binding protein [Betaproteobacteria bacterium]|jgi:spermidine/putrescine transport system ATP-binding protein|nr:ABC transporter ATP-binding protein [Rhodocyclaceae bacterium]MCA3134823.1 ABC transporter ATP-binding protein [Rhodocyclaceae bacterium]MCA3142305.1 ABC transporter ATP-binding protein [Rhodocyclaceae bacterium]MCA3146406.1 ABC transporter ATP-binding protein [Rhodocyclaceae bacterium]MCE2898082.1 ABC transporter ATP-binding protein [Betaproteobacteria bacterium]
MQSDDDSPQADGQSLLRVAGARRTFLTPEGSAVRALDGVDLNIRPNEFLTLLGPSGCGKTTLLRAIAGFEDLDGGRLELEGRSLEDVPPHRRPFNTVFQSYALFPHLDARDNVGYGLDAARVPRAERERRVDEALALVGLSELGRRRPRQLSGGQQQRVALARALVNRPRLLLLDEPLSALDRGLRQAMQIELKNLQHTVGITFVVVTHDQEEALTMSDRIAVMRAGRILQLGPPGRIYDTPADRFVARFVGDSNVHAGRVAAVSARGALITLDEGFELHAEGTGFAPGEAVDAMLRPERLMLAREPGAGPALQAVVERVVFVGADVQVHLRLPGGAALRALHRHLPGAEPPPNVGGQAFIRYEPAAVHLMRSAP